MKKTMMAIGAHVGDMELTAGGVLASMALEGHRVITVALTAGEKGNPTHISIDDYRAQKIKEAQTFADMLGGQAIVLPFKDGELPESDDVKYLLADLIRQHKPDILITHWKNSMHKDHEVTHRIVKDAQFYAGLAGIKRSLPHHWANGPYYAENWEDKEGFQPYVYIKVSQQGFDLWKKAIDVHWFALNSPSFKYKEYYESLMRVRGKEARLSFAQAFDVSDYAKKLIKESF